MTHTSLEKKSLMFPEILNWADKLGVDPNDCKPERSFLQNTISKIKNKFSSPELILDE
ncbi:hypothetical protein [Methanolobus bombayensis]|uniref:hypothetical protein n=1 Tax=Methanolobus bombayensis TaxID=38023 RepID=UPI001AE72330|nr:hypothetical protein [Methanolobus bombayensis]MBP1910112.1 hypothetical protein [Methanolobus bombayensis]